MIVDSTLYNYSTAKCTFSHDFRDLGVRLSVKGSRLVLSKDLGSPEVKKCVPVLSSFSHVTLATVPKLSSKHCKQQSSNEVDQSMTAESSPDCDYSVRFDRWQSFEHVDPQFFEDNTKCRGTGPCCGLLNGTGIAIAAYFIAKTSNIVFIGDLIVVVFIILFSVLPLYGYWNLKYLKPSGERSCIGDVIDSTPSCIGSLYGLLSILSLSIVHILLRVSAYKSIQSDDEEMNPVVWVIAIGSTLLFCEMLCCCYIDYRKSKRQQPDWSDDQTDFLFDVIA